MQLSAPKQITFWISVLLLVVGVVLLLVLPKVTVYAIAVIIIGFVLLILGNMLKGL